MSKMTDHIARADNTAAGRRVEAAYTEKNRPPQATWTPEERMAGFDKARKHVFNKDTCKHHGLVDCKTCYAIGESY